MLPYGTFAIFQFTWFYFLRCFLFLFEISFCHLETWCRISPILQPDRVHYVSQNLLIESQQWKHQNNVWNLSKVNNKNTRMASVTPFWCRYWQLWTDFAFFSSWNAIAYSKLHAKLLVHVHNNMLNSFKVNNVEAVTKGVL